MNPLSVKENPNFFVCYVIISFFKSKKEYWLSKKDKKDIFDESESIKIFLVNWNLKRKIYP